MSKKKKVVSRKKKMENVVSVTWSTYVRSSMYISLNRAEGALGFIRRAFDIVDALEFTPDEAKSLGLEINDQFARWENPGMCWKLNLPFTPDHKDVIEQVFQQHRWFVRRRNEVFDVVEELGITLVSVEPADSVGQVLEMDVVACALAHNIIQRFVAPGMLLNAVDNMLFSLEQPIIAVLDDSVTKTGDDLLIMEAEVAGGDEGMSMVDVMLTPGEVVILTELLPKFTQWSVHDEPARRRLFGYLNISEEE